MMRMPGSGAKRSITASRSSAAAAPGQAHHCCAARRCGGACGPYSAMTGPLHWRRARQGQEEMIVQVEVEQVRKPPPLAQEVTVAGRADIRLPINGSPGCCASAVARISSSSHSPSSRGSRVAGALDHVRDRIHAEAGHAALHPERHHPQQFVAYWRMGQLQVWLVPVEHVPVERRPRRPMSRQTPRSAGTSAAGRRRARGRSTGTSGARPGRRAARRREPWVALAVCCITSSTMMPIPRASAASTRRWNAVWSPRRGSMR